MLSTNSRTLFAFGFLSFFLLVPALAADDKAALRLSGSIYLFEYLPRTRGSESKFEIYAVIVNADSATADERFGLHVQARGRDTKLRSFFPSNVWFQEAYVFAKVGSHDEVHAGKVYRRVGLFWDDTFFGNVQYFNGLKLNPDYGAEWIGSRGSDQRGVGYSVQYFSNNDHVDGSLPGRDVESDPDAKLGPTVTARLEPHVSLTPAVALDLGASALSGSIDRHDAANITLRQLALDATLTRGGSAIFGEALRQNGASEANARSAYVDSNYLLAGVRTQFASKWTGRVSVSAVDYRGRDAREREIVPGIVFSPRPELSLIAEYDDWRSRSSGTTTVIDRSFDLVIHYVFKGLQ